MICRVLLRTLWILTLLSVCCFCSFAQELDFSGAVKNGETFRKEIGHGLVFILAPEADGYGIAIEPVRGGDPNNNNFTTCVTPPFHGPNPTSLTTRDFQDEHGNPLPRKVVAGRKNREFSFVLTAADQKKASDELSEALYGQEKKDTHGDAVLGFCTIRRLRWERAFLRCAL